MVLTNALKVASVILRLADMEARSRTWRLGLHALRLRTYHTDNSMPVEVRLCSSCARVVIVNHQYVAFLRFPVFEPHSCGAITQELVMA